MGTLLTMKDWSDGKTLSSMSDAYTTTEIHDGKAKMPAFTTLPMESARGVVRLHPHASAVGHSAQRSGCAREASNHFQYVDHRISRFAGEEYSIETMLTAPEVFRVSSTAPHESDEDVHWTIALAGGEGVRLQEYVERRGGRRTPKQYCPLLGSRSMLEHTLARLNELTPARRTLTVIGTNHRPYAMQQLSGASDHVFCQPCSRDTGVALYVAMAMIKRWAPKATLTITPTDHYIEPSARYLHHVGVARNVATRIRDLVVLLGVRPSEPDPELGYVSIGGQITEVPEARRVGGFVEKPSVLRAEQLIQAGALWNTMVACGTVDAFWSIGRSAAPHLIAVLDCLVPLVGTAEESEAIDYIYRAYPSVSLSSDILTRRSQQLAVIELDGVEWSDWGRPERVETVLALRRNRAAAIR